MSTRTTGRLRHAPGIPILRRSCSTVKLWPLLMMRSSRSRKFSAWSSRCATLMGGPQKKFVTSWRFPRLTRGCCSIGRGQKYVVLWKIIFRLQEGRIVAEAELTCKELTEIITDYLEGRLQQTEHVRFEQHLSVCSGCVTYLHQMRTTIKALGAKPRVEIPQSIQSDLLQAFRDWKHAR